MKMKKLFWPLMLMMLLINIVTGCGGGGGGKKSGENKGGGPFASLPPHGWVNYLGAVAQVGQKIYFIGGSADSKDAGIYYLFDNIHPEKGFYYNCTTGEFSK